MSIKDLPLNSVDVASKVTPWLAIKLCDDTESFVVSINKHAKILVDT
jgi:hypothetical protein